MHLLPRIAALALVALPAFAQETYWIANRGSSDIMQISAWGSVMQRIAMPTTLRSCIVAPDGKIWVVRFIQGTFDIVDPSTNPATITPITSTLGSPYDIAFDAVGNGWVSGGSGVQQFSPAGVLIQAFPLTTAAPLGITIDSAGNKWIAHRVTPASVTRIDPTGAVTNFPLAGVTTQPTKIIADYRGILAPSRMWVVGDGAAQLVEIDDQGTLLNNYALPITSVGSVVFDKNGDIWVGSFGATGSLLRIDRNTGGVLNTYGFPPSILGLAVDSFGRILATARTATGIPCEVRRIDAATGVLEVPTILQFGTFVSAGTQAAVSTPFQYSMVVSQLGDLDGDGEVNYLEILNGTSPIDRWSSSVFSVNTTGITAIGNTAFFNAQTAPGSFWLLTFSFGLVAPGSGITLPGFGGELLLNPVLGLGVTVSGVGSGTLSLAIPNDPSYQGQEWFTQGFVAGGSGVQFTNVSGVKFW